MKTAISIILCIVIATVPAMAQEIQTTPAREIFVYVQQPPKPDYDITAYISKNIKYPKAAKKYHVEGKIIVKFIVNEDGSISDAKVIKGKELGHGLPEEALRIVNSMPKWKPGSQNGRAVNVYQTLPFMFKKQ